MNPKRVLFVCLGNACRSQMAEAFARAYGSDVLVPASAGLTPAFRLPDDTIRAMAEKNLDMSAHFPKSIHQLGRADFDLVINLTGTPLMWPSDSPVEDWRVADPIMLDYEQHCAVRDQIEGLVMRLILELRRQNGNGAETRRGSIPRTPHR